ncbi:MAG: hypothetical protein ACI4XF_11125 [Oscillospiraceae bacterium]
MKNDNYSEGVQNENEDVFGGQLLPYESILWTGAGKVQSRAFMVLFALFWLGFSLLWTGMVYFLGGKGMALFGVIFIVIGVGLLIKAFRKNEPDRYALTNMRVLILSGGKYTEIKLEQIVNIDTYPGKQSTGYLDINANYFRDNGSIDTASHRISNINDPGYVRELILTERDRILH